VLYHLSHTPSPFLVLVCFWDFFFLGVGWWCVLMELEFELRASPFLYHLSHISSSFHSGYFENCLPRLGSNQNPPDLCLLSSWDYRCEQLVPGSKAILYHCKEWLDSSLV
jgi:hypothetical protein